MANNETYQPGPEDFRLARELNRLNETGDSAGPSDDSLFNALETYKASVQLKRSGSAHAELWNNIDKQIEQDSRRFGGTGSVFSIYSPYFKIAAAILVVVLVSILYLTLQDSETEFVAASGADRAELTLEDGSTVTLRPHSSIKTIEVTEDQITYKIVGEAYFDVATDINRTFSVLAGEGRVDVLGTRFTVSDWSSEVRVFLEEGRVRFSDSMSGESVTLEPGQYSMLSANGLSQPESGDSTTFVGWMDNVISLDQRSLKDIAAELSHHYDVRLMIPDEAAEVSLSGSIRLDDLDDVLKDLELSLGGEFVPVGENSYRFTETP
jgi:ferric-dicitrate binding protein FerR (iron transport regulator)